MLEPRRAARLLATAVRNVRGSDAFWLRTEELRAAKSKETRLHRVADSHVPALSVAFRHAFAMGRKALGRPPHAGAAVEAIKFTLRKTLPATLVKVAVDGGNVALGNLKALGDVEGHPFHGNQWTAGGSITTSAFGNKLQGIEIPKREKNQVYLVRYSKANEMESSEALGQWAHAHADVNVGIDASSYYSKTSMSVDARGMTHSAPHEGYLYIGRGDKRDVLDKQASGRGRGNSGEREVLGALTKDNLDVVINVRTGEKVWERKSKRLRASELRVAKKSDTPSTKINIRFDSSNPRAVDWADRHAAELIDGISETTREDINNAIADALERGSIDDAYDEILAAVGDADRAELIARNEVMRAASEGQRMAWAEATDEGLLTGDEKRTWIAVGDGKVCPICEDLDGATADLDGEYPGEGGDGPPAHVSCRCTEGLSS